MPRRKLRKYDFKMTPQRLAIIEYLKNNKEHPSALDVFRAISKKFPTISFATVYNTLEMLKNKGMVLELNIDPERKRYDPDVSPHHHLKCTKCGKVLDISMDLPVDTAQLEKRGFSIDRIQVDIYGKCPPCKAKQKEER